MHPGAERDGRPWPNAWILSRHESVEPPNPPNKFSIGSAAFTEFGGVMTDTHAYWPADKQSAERATFAAIGHINDACDAA